MSEKCHLASQNLLEIFLDLFKQNGGHHRDEIQIVYVLQHKNISLNNMWGSSS